MGRGRLRVLLGAAPGVGKTYAMLEEGRHLERTGLDVVVALVETHGRAATASLVDGFELVPRRTVAHRGVDLDELDVDATVARRPDVALVDELAHTNAPGSRNEKRWQDVDELLDAGIDVVSTVNVQHIESLADVVRDITGVVQRETIPDRVLRDADQVEIVDLDPRLLRQRLADGFVYPAERVDAALANYFRLGNLTALRELALLWLADEVDEALRSYRASHGIEGTWEARERVVVTLTGGHEGETLVRRAARIAARSSGGDLVAVHVVGEDGLRPSDPGALAAQRALVERLGGTYHQIVGDDVPRALVDFARAANATQLVLGASRRSRLAAAVAGPGIGATVIREAGDIDVHIVTHAAAGRAPRLPRLGGALSVRRRLAGFAVALVAGPLLTILLSMFRSEDSFASDVLSYQLLVIVVALTGGFWPATFAAVLSGLTLDYFLVDPVFTISIGAPLHVLALALYVVNGVLVSFVVDRSARLAKASRRSAAESELLATVAGSVVRGEDAVAALVERTREAFGLSRVALVARPDGRVLAADGADAGDARGARGAEDATGSAGIAEAGRREAAVGAPDGTDGSPSAVERIAVGDRATLELVGRQLAASERRLLAAIVTQLESVLDLRDLEEIASELEPLAASDRVRGALLSAISHDLRRPLAAASAAVGGIREAGASLGEEDRNELLATADESLATLTALVADLLDVTRLEAGALGIRASVVDPADAIVGALDELGLGPDEVELDLSPEAAEVVADPALLQRAIVNLLANAMRFSPPGTRARLTTSAFDGRVEIRVVDRGPGIPQERRDEVFVPFQRLGDTDNTTGLGLGLALSKGFVEGMGGALSPEDTPGGGLTMVVSLAAPDADDARATASGPMPPRMPGPPSPSASAQGASAERDENGP